MKPATLLTALAFGLLAIGTFARPAEKMTSLKDALAAIKEKKAALAKELSGSGSSSSDSGDWSSSGSGEWDWDVEDIVAWLHETCGGVGEEDGPLTPTLLAGELGDFAGYLAEVTDAVVTHREDAETMADTYADIDVTDDMAFHRAVMSHIGLFHRFSQSMHEVSHGAMCTMFRLQVIKFKFEFEGTDGFAQSDDECAAASNMVRNSDDIVASVQDREWMGNFGAAMRADITCAANEIEEFSNTVAGGLAAANGDLSVLTRREVSEIFMHVEHFMDTAAREVYDFSFAVHTVGGTLRHLYGQADTRVADMKAAEQKAKSMAEVLEMFKKIMKKEM